MGIDWDVLQAVAIIAGGGFFYMALCSVVGKESQRLGLGVRNGTILSFLTIDGDVGNLAVVIYKYASRELTHQLCLTVQGDT